MFFFYYFILYVIVINLELQLEAKDLGRLCVFISFQNNKISH